MAWREMQMFCHSCGPDTTIVFAVYFPYTKLNTILLCGLEDYSEHFHLEKYFFKKR